MMGGKRLSWESMKLGNHSIQWIILVLIIVMTVCLSTLATLFFVEHYDAVRTRYYDSMDYHRRQDMVAAEQAAAAAASAAAQIIGSKQHSIAYSHNYSTMNDHVGGQTGKSGKKSTTYKSDGGGGGGAGAGQNQMAFPSFTDNRSGTSGMAGGATGNGIGVDPGQQLNWSNIEFSFLYIYKLQQYYNELQKKNKGKGLKQLEVAGQVDNSQRGLAPVSSADVMADSPSNTEEDCDSAEVVATAAAGDPAEDNNNPAGDLKLDEEFMNQFLASILNVRNQSAADSLKGAAGGDDIVLVSVDGISL